MAYQESTTLATPEVMLNHLSGFCEAAGWTVERNESNGANRYVTLRKPGITDYIHLYNTDMQNIRMRISVGYDDLLPIDQQPGVSGESRTFLNNGAYPKTFFFASQDQVWIVVGIAASGEYRHFCFGRLEKSGEYVGGTYVDGTTWPYEADHQWATWGRNTWPFRATRINRSSAQPVGWLRCDIPDDGKAESYHRIGGIYNDSSDTSAAYGEVGDQGRAALLALNADDNAFSGRSILHTIPVFVGRTGSALYFSPAGTVQDVRVCSMQKFEVEQEITIGSDVWKLFPLIAKRPMNTATGVQPAASGNYGVAIKKVV